MNNKAFDEYSRKSRYHLICAEAIAQIYVRDRAKRGAAVELSKVVWGIEHLVFGLGYYLRKYLLINRINTNDDMKFTELIDLARQINGDVLMGNNCDEYDTEAIWQMLDNLSDISPLIFTPIIFVYVQQLVWMLDNYAPYAINKCHVYDREASLDNEKTPFVGYLVVNSKDTYGMLIPMQNDEYKEPTAK